MTAAKTALRIKTVNVPIEDMFYRYDFMKAYNGTQKFNRISMKELDKVRENTKAVLDYYSAIDGVRYKMRTFYYGPRPSRSSMTARKADATAAKIAIYEVKTTKFGGTCYKIIAYV